MSEIIIGPDHHLVDYRLHNRHDNGWYFGAGDPEFWQFSDRMLIPGGRLLDIGIGEARTSMYFALNGMEVTGVDTVPKRIAAVNEMAAEMSGVMPFSMQALELDASAEPLPPGRFDTVTFGHVIHLGSKQEAFDMFDKALGALKPGGHIWVRGAGKQSQEYEEVSLMAEDEWYPEFDFVDRDVITHPCACSGEMKIEPTLYFDPLDLNVFFASRGCKTVHSQTIPTAGKMNIMFGEDYNRSHFLYEKGGMVTILAQKP